VWTNPGFGHSQRHHRATVFLKGYSENLVTMLAAHHDQENLYTHQAGASKQQLQAKTPGARYPKTPLKVPLNDENANHGFGGKSILQTKGNNENVVTAGKGGNGLGKFGKPAVVTPAGMFLTVSAQLFY
jgi:hypothetical protein